MLAAEPLYFDKLQSNSGEGEKTAGLDTNITMKGKLMYNRVA